MGLTGDDMRFSFETGPIATLSTMQECYSHMKAVAGGSIIDFGSGSDR